MQTQCVAASEESILRAAELLQKGELVGFPTETVYGLGANALDAAAVLRIFAAKERPADNPLIVHIADFSDALPLCRMNAMGERLAAAFWPGPLTMILPRTDLVPDAVTAGLDSVALRLPAHPVAQRLLRAAGVPVAAPSANRSGRPSPTLAKHVLEDMDGRIPLILDGGPCDVGVESTVVSLTGETPVVLRPGGITPEMIAMVLGTASVADSVMRPLREGESAPSPGMKHKHYAPRGQMTLYTGDGAAVAQAICRAYDALPQSARGLILCAEESLPRYGARRTQSLGADAKTAAQRIFALLRDADTAGITRVLSESFPSDGVGLAVMNRMARAAGFDIVACDSCTGRAPVV